MFEGVYIFSEGSDVVWDGINVGVNVTLVSDDNENVIW